MSSRLKIRQKYQDGESIAQIAREGVDGHQLDWKTAAKYAKAEDFSPKPPAPEMAARRMSKLDGQREFIDAILIGDRTVWRKQRHTARRIWQRLRDERGLDVSERQVERYVAARRKVLGEVKSGPLELVWEPGVAQVDFGDADVTVCGQVERRHFLVVSFPYSNMGYVQLFGGQDAMCVCQGLMDVFAKIGGVPQRLVFDNATGVGHRVGAEVTKTELFTRFEAHYGFTTRFCNPRSGNEKGNVERKVAFARQAVFVPVQEIPDMEAFNRDVLETCEELEFPRRHYAKERETADLFFDDLAALRPLPACEFEAVDYRQMTGDGWGGITMGKHHYSGDPASRGQAVTVAVGAHRLTIVDPTTGEILAEHLRQWGDKPTRSVDVRSQIHELARKPGAWHDSAVRGALDAGVVALLDGLDADTLAEGLSEIDQAMERSGTGATMEVLAARAQRSGADLHGVALSARLALHTPPGAYTDDPAGPDLSVYDQLTGAIA